MNVRLRRADASAWKFAGHRPGPQRIVRHGEKALPVVTPTCLAHRSRVLELQLIDTARHLPSAKRSIRGSTQETQRVLRELERGDRPVITTNHGNQIARQRPELDRTTEPSRREDLPFRRERRDRDLPRLVESSEPLTTRHVVNGTERSRAGNLDARRGRSLERDGSFQREGLDPRIERSREGTNRTRQDDNTAAPSQESRRRDLRRPRCTDILAIARVLFLSPRRESHSSSPSQEAPRVTEVVAVDVLTSGAPTRG